MTEAAILEAANRPLELVDLELEEPRAGEIVVELGATGVCHSDVSVYNQTLPTGLPIVLGHEGAGTVVEVGDGVTNVRSGDRVVLAWLAQCGACFYCTHGQPALCEVAGQAMARGTLLDGTTRFKYKGESVYHMVGLGTFSRRCVVSAKAAVKVPDSLDISAAALIGCGVLTGFGAAVNTADIRTGDTVAVLGCGGVGLNAIQGASVSGASQIVAVDMHPERLKLAEKLGATHTIEAGDEVVGKIRELTSGRGADVALEVVGRQETIRDAIKMSRRGGQIILVGAGDSSVTVNVPAFTGVVMTEKTIRGSLYGSTNTLRDVDLVCRLYEAGQLELDELVSATFKFEEVNEAIAYCASESGTRAVMQF